MPANNPNSYKTTKSKTSGLRTPKKVAIKKMEAPNSAATESATLKDLKRRLAARRKKAKG